MTNQKVISADFDRLNQFANEKYSLPLLIYDVEWLRVRLENPDYLQIRRQYLGLDEDSLPAFLEIDEYAERRIDRDFAPDLEIFLGREKEVEQIESFQKSTNKVVVVSGLPGLGKTKVLIEAAKKIQGLGNAHSNLHSINECQYVYDCQYQKEKTNRCANKDKDRPFLATHDTDEPNY